MAGFNPIALVGTTIDVNGNITNGVTIVAPASYDYDWEDISKSNAGRTEDIEMHKNRIGRVKSISLAWSAITFTDCAGICAAFNSEYFYVKFFDVASFAFITKQFYTGNVSASLKNTSTGKVDSLSFKIVTKKNAL